MLFNLWHVLKYQWGDRNMSFPCFKIHGVVMFQGGEMSTMAPIKNLIMEITKPRNNVNVKYNLNGYTIHESLILNDVETPMMENFKHAYVSKK